MAKIIQIASFELNDESLMEEWKVMSTGISEAMKNLPGFISRDSAVGEDGKIYCVLKWENKESQEAARKMIESPETKDKMEAFAKIANMQTMASKFLEIL